MVVDIGHCVDCLLGDDGQLTWRTCGSRCHLLRDDHELVVVNATIDETCPFGFDAIEHLAKNDRGHRRLGADEATEHPSMSTTRMNADLQESSVELGPTSGDTNIAAERKVHASTNSGPVDRCKRRQGTAGDTQEAFVDATQALVGGFREVAQVCAGTKGWSGASDDDGTNSIIGFDRVHCRQDFCHHWTGQCVAFGGIVQGDRGNAIDDGKFDKAHRVILPCGCQRLQCATVAAVTEPADLPPARPAATVVVVREHHQQLEVLLLKRSEFGMFAGMWVFPGGRVDDDDPGDDELSRAKSAAVREAQEEVGLGINTDGLITLSHWTPPLMAPKRYVTWFFVAEWNNDAVVIDGHEIVEARWVTPAMAMRDEFQMAPPTQVTVSVLDEAGSFVGLQHLIERRGIERFVTALTKHEGDLMMLWEGDAGYESADASLPGLRHRMGMPNGHAGRYERTI